MATNTVTLEKIYQKIGKLEREIAEIKYSVLPVEKISKKQIRELKKTSLEMEKGSFLTSRQAIAFLEK